MVVLKTQELAGIDPISDGELSRFDVSHPQTNGMIDYFIRPMGGISSTITREDFQPSSEWGFAPSRPEWWSAVTGGRKPPERLAAARPQLASMMFTFTAPYMLARTLIDRHYGDIRS